jgi:MinD-like ATPase involved in chromosome partitioning or flagellar assembly
MIPGGTRLYSWLDVEGVIRRAKETPSPDLPAWPEGLLEARGYWDGLELTVSSKQVLPTVEEWIQILFSPRVTTGSESRWILLEGLTDQPRRLPVTFSFHPEVPAAKLRPSFSRTPLVKEHERIQPVPLPPNTPPILVFHSFKGGVGRTTCALATALAMKQLSLQRKRKGRILLVDGDLEAPGISLLLRSKRPEPTVSLADLLTLVHGDPTADKQATIELVADRMRRDDVDGIYVLPASRDEGAWLPEVLPEHVVRGPSPFILTDVLVRLGKQLDVDAVIVDLRAGYSEHSASFLLDRRVIRVHVTAPNGQSVEGTCTLLRWLADHGASESPTVFLNQVPPNLREALGESRRALEEALGPIEDLETGVALFEVDYVQDLMMVGTQWDEVVRLLQGESEYSMRRQVERWLTRLSLFAPSASELPTGDLGKQREKLAEFARLREYAERQFNKELLATDPLTELARAHLDRVPATVVVGAKGSGKTFTFIQMASRVRWSEFVQAVLPGQTGGADAWMLPLLTSLDLDGQVKKTLSVAEAEVHGGIGAKATPLGFLPIRDEISEGIQQGWSERRWRTFWLSTLVRRCGLEAPEGAEIDTLNRHLAENDAYIVALVDGLENAFPRFSTSEVEQRGLKALLQDVPDWLEQSPERRAGIIVFIRSDLVQAAIPQNLGQFLRRHERFALKWDPIRALELVAWLASGSGVLELPPERERSGYHAGDWAEHLVPLWGRKLGGPDSKEGRSALWVLAALMDFQGLVQARDVVRFIAEAALGSRRDSKWADRLLVPQAIKDALVPTGQRKVEEVGLENPPLMAIFNELRGLPDELRRIPIDIDVLRKQGIDGEKFQLLEQAGILTVEGEGGYLAEIYRAGLSFGKDSRSRVINLVRKRLPRELL